MQCMLCIECCQLFPVYCILCTIIYALYSVNCSWFLVLIHRFLYFVCILFYALYFIHWMLSIVSCALYFMHYNLCIVFCEFFLIPCPVYIVFYILYLIHYLAIHALQGFCLRGGGHLPSEVSPPPSVTEFPPSKNICHPIT